MAEQRDPWEVYSAAPSSISGPAKVPDAPKPYEVETDQAQLTGIELANEQKRRELAKGADKPTIDPKISAGLNTDEALAGIARARQLISGWSTGVGGQLLSNIGSTDARDLRTVLNTVASGVTLGKLSELKAQSAQGASGLGALSEREGELLRDSVAGLDQFQSQEGLLASLDSVERHYRNVLALTNGEDPTNGDVQKKYGIVSQTPDGQTAVVGAPPPPPDGPTYGAPGSNPQVGAATELAQGDTAVENDPALAGVNAEVAKRIASGQSTDEVSAYLRSAGVNLTPGTLERINGWTQFIKANPSYRGAIGVSLEQREVPLSETRQLLNRAAQSPLGTAVASSADALTAFQLPRLTGNAPLARAGLDALANRSPVASALGTLVGGVGAGVGIEAGLGRLGIQGAAGALAPRLLASDAIYGGAAANGLDPESGISGALTGAALGATAGVGARAGVRALGGIVSPSGGDLPISYAGGSRPTIGQRFGREGVVGDTVNKAEQALMSVPGLGSSVRTARQGARDGWETTGIRNALREVGDDLPEGIERGPEAMAYMRQSFSRAYDEARSGMQFVPDGEFKRDLGAYTRRVVNSGILDGETRNQLESILNNSVSSRLRNGGLSGEAYKIAYSDLGDAITAASRKPELQQALREYRDLFEGAARRNSDPEAVAKMDAADRGYSQYRPMRDASAMAGSEPGRFTPTALASVERRTKGKTAAYVEGNTRLGDYVNEGMALRDTLPDSGTAGRLLTMGAGSGAALSYAPTPLAAAGGAVLGTLTGATLPGVRNVVGAALAPRSSAKLRTLGDIIRERQTALGYAGAPLALEYQGQ